MRCLSACLLLSSALLAPLLAGATCDKDAHQERAVWARQEQSYRNLFTQQGSADTPAMAHRILARLIEAAPPAALAWRLATYQDTDINAQASADGALAVSQGAWALFPEEDLRAALLAHEMSHALLRHALQAECRMRPLLKAVGTGKRLSVPALDAAERAYRELMHTQEFEADELATHLLVSAGYPPTALTQLLRRLPELTRTSRTHPSNQEREARLAR